jgi:hypothetical protein
MFSTRSRSDLFRQLFQEGAIKFVTELSFRLEAHTIVRMGDMNMMTEALN